MKNKSSRVLIAVITIFNLVFCNMNLVQADTILNANKADIIDSVNLTHEDGSEAPYYTWDIVRVEYNWSLKNHKKGDVIKLKLPKELVLENDINFNLDTPEGITIGEVYGNTKGDITVNLTDPKDYIESHTNIQGNMFFQTQINTKLINKPGKYPLDFEVNGEIKKIVIEVKPDSIPNKNEVIAKYGVINLEENYIEWKLRVNYAQKPINDAVLIENLGEGQEYIKGSIKILQVVYDHSTGGYSEAVDVTGNFNILENSKGFIIDFGNIGKGYRVTFKSKITDKTLESYKNNVKLKGSNNIDETRLVEERVSTGGGNGSGDKLFSVTLVKKDENSKERLSGAEFILKDSEDNIIKSNLVTDIKGEISVTGLLPGTYKFIEIKAPKGYELDSTPLEFTINLNGSKNIILEIINKPILKDNEDKVQEELTPPKEESQNNNKDNNINKDKYVSDNVKNSINKEHVKKDAPKTGDTSILKYGCIALLASIGISIINLKSRK